MNQFKPGDKVHYTAHEGAKPENGIVKKCGTVADCCWVVYKCDGNWERYQDYTSALTANNELKIGWV